MLQNLFYSDGSPVTFSKSEELFLQTVMDDFDQFLVDHEHSYIQLEGSFLVDGSLAVKKIPLTYSCDVKYQNEQMAKLYRLNDWYNTLPPNRRVITMMTLTTYQRDFKNYFEQYDFLRDSWLKLKDVMKKELGDFDYLVIAEPHKSGFVHYHILLFKWVANSQAKRYQTLWYENYIAGSKSRGINFKVDMSGSVRSLKNYLMKYMAKNFTLTFDEKFIPDTDLMRFSEPSKERASLSPENKSYFLKVFHAVKWYMNKRDSDYKGFRAFQPSRTLSRIMALPKKENTTVAWHSVYLVMWGVSRLIRYIESPLKAFIKYSSNLLSPPLDAGDLVPAFPVFPETFKLCVPVCGKDYDDSMKKFLSSGSPIDWEKIKRFVIG